METSIVSQCCVWSNKIFIKVAGRSGDEMSLYFPQSMNAAEGNGPHSGENWMEVTCDDDCLNKTENSTSYSDVSAIRWTLTNCEDTIDAIRIAELYAVVCAKLNGNSVFFIKCNVSNRI